MGPINARGTGPLRLINAQAETPDERELAELLKASLDVPQLTNGRRTLVKRRLMYGMRARRRFPVWRSVAFAAGMSLLLVGGLARARLVAWVKPWFGVDAAMIKPLPPAPRPRLVPAQPVLERDDFVEAANEPPSQPPAPSPRPSLGKRDRRSAAALGPATKPAAHAAASTTEPPSPEQAALLGEAWRRLRKQRDPAAALAWLEHEAAALSQGPLRSEAFVARIEALLALGDRARATLELERTELTTSDPRLQLLRAELYLARGMPNLAVVDFSRIASICSRAATCARALYGQAQAFAAMGDNDQARLAFERLLQRYPQSEHARIVARKWEKALEPSR